MTTEQILLEKIENLESQIAILSKKNKEYEFLIQTKELKEVKKDYKDRLFKFIFGNPENKEWTLSLYNAINGTTYSNPDEITFNTIGEAVYMGMKNDVSFIISFEMNLWEHQSTFNPNMPMRFFLYAGRLYERYIATSDYYQYSSNLQLIPRPICICFYNGKREQPEKQVLRLSDAYDGDGDIEVQVTMLNVNRGKNRQIMEVCKPLDEYAWIVDAVRCHQYEKMDLDSAVDAALDEMPDDFLIKPFLMANRAEVKNMFLTEYNEEKVLEQERQEGRREGRQEGKQEGRQEGKLEILIDLVKDGILSVTEASKRAGISPSEFQSRITASIVKG